MRNLSNPFTPIQEAEILSAFALTLAIGNLITKVNYVEAPIKDLKELEREAIPFYIQEKYVDRDFFSTFKKISVEHIEYKYEGRLYYFMTIPRVLELKNGKKVKIYKYFDKLYKSMKYMDVNSIYKVSFVSEKIKEETGIFPFDILYFMDKFIVYHVDNSYNRKILKYKDGLDKGMLVPKKELIFNVIKRRI